MKTSKIAAVLLALALGITRVTSPLAEEVYGAQRLAEDRSYEFHEVLRAALEETRLRLPWHEQAAERFPDEPMFSQALEAERERAAIMRQQFAAWGFTEESADPPTLEVPPGFEHVLRALRDLAERGMIMCQRLEELGETQDDARFQAYMWGHEYRNQPDNCDLRADELGYTWAWMYGDEELNQNQNQEQSQEQNSLQADVNPDQEQNQKMNGTQGENGQNQQRNGNHEGNGGNSQNEN